MYKVILILVAFSIGNIQLFAQGISVSPSRIVFKGMPGEVVSQVITMSNTSSGELNFISSVKDWDRDSLGLKQYYPQSTLKFSNSSWLNLSSTRVQLGPHETKTVTVNMRIPESELSKELSTSMLFFTQVNEQKPSTTAGGLGIQVLFEVGIQVYHIPAGLEEGDLDFIAFEDFGVVSSTPEGKRRVGLKVKNTGKINKDAQLKIELTNTSTGAEIPVKTTSIALLPTSEQWVVVDLPGNLKGDYLAVAILDAGDRYDIKIAEKKIIY